MSTALRKALTSRAYTLLFRKVLPYVADGHKIGQAEHAQRLNDINRHRRQESFAYADLTEFSFQVDPGALAVDFDFTVKENNFINWINGSASPRHLVMINAIVEYTMETCRDEDKHMLLKYELLQVLRSEDFLAYTEHLIDEAVAGWIVRIGQDDAGAVYKALKDVLYLLKNKARHVAIVLAEQAQQAGPNTIAEPTEPVDLPDMTEHMQQSDVRAATEHVRQAVPPDASAKAGVVDLYAIQSILPAPLRTWIRRIPQVFGMPVIVSVLVITLLVLANRSPNAATLRSDPLQFSSWVSSAFGVHRARPVPPEILAPKNDSLRPGGGVELTWAPSDWAESYTVAVTDTASWKQVFLKRDIRDTTFTLDASLFQSGGHYRLFVLCARGSEETEPGFVDIRIEALAPPVITAPTDVAMLPLTDLEVRWDPVPETDAYVVEVKDVTTWRNLVPQTTTQDTAYRLDRNLFESGGQYRIYVLAMRGQIISRPAYVTVSFEREPTQPPASAHD